MPTFKKPDHTPIAPQTFAELLKQDGWRLMSGFGVAAKDAGSRIVRSSIQDQCLVIEAEREGGEIVSIFRIGIEDRLVYGAYPYLLHVIRPRLEECDQPKALGGGKQQKKLMRVYLNIRNQELHDKEEEHIRAAEESEHEAQVAADREFVSFLGAIGRRLTDITRGPKGHGTVLHFADHNSLYVPVSLRDLRPGPTSNR